VRVTFPNFVPIGQIVPEIWPFFDFQDGGRPPSWMFYACLDHLRRVHVLDGGLLSLCKIWLESVQ